MRKCIPLVLLLACAVQAEVRLPSVLAEHMVLQRGIPISIWGSADPAESVSVTFRGETRTAAADELGRWSVYLPPAQAGGPFDLSIRGKNEISFRDILVGDVWIASGQSNMEFALEKANNAQAEVAAASNTKIRLFHVRNKSSVYPQTDAVADPWIACTPASAAKFSAVAYFFGRELQQKTGVPIGLISTSWGGTPAEAWTSMSALGSDASLMPVFADWASMTNDQATIDLRRAKQLREYDAARAKARAEGKPEPGYPWAPNLDFSWMPAGLYNAMIAPLTRFPIKGAIWYQGESNTGELTQQNHRPSVYHRLFETMIQDWRRAWGIGDFPFLFVQLANFNRGPNSMWPEVREAQLQTLQLANTGMTVTIDIGNATDIHPTNKQDVGHRLALAARALGYGEQIEFSGPIYRTARPEGAGIRIWFEHATGLTSKGTEVRGFEVAGADRNFVPAEGRIDGSTLVVSSGAVRSPVYVRYAWAPNPDCNLYNAAGLPASPFRSAE